MTASELPEVTLNEAAHRFELHVDGHTAVEVFERFPGGIAYLHTIVPKALEGRGIAAQLVTAALTWARAQQLQVNPVCSYVVAYIRRHPEWQDLLASAP